MTWEPTDEVPPTGMAAYADPDPALTPLTTLSAGLRLHRIEDRGAWAKVAADNGWSAWVDGRLLVPISTTPNETPAAVANPAAPHDPTPTNPPVASPARQATHQPIAGTAEPASPAVGAPLGAPSGPLGGGVPSAFAPPSGASSTSSTALDPLGIAAAILGVALVVTFLLPWATFSDSSDHAFELAGDGRGAFGDFGTRTDVGIVLLQALYGAIVLGPVAAVLFVVRRPAARVVGTVAGGAGVLVVVGRLLLDVPRDPGVGLGVWLSLLASVALVALSLGAGSRSGAGAAAQKPSGSW